MSFVLTSPLPEKGATIPIFTAFTGHKRVPLWAVATNGLNPKLRFFEDDIELKVIKTHRRAWSDLESVDAFTMWKTNNLILNFIGTPWNFSANLILPSYLRETLRFLKRKNLVLSPRALGILDS